MKVFISWSGDRSHLAAQALKDWLPVVLQEVQPWVSQDIEAGQRWTRQIDEELSKTGFGILCLTPENLEEPWILFEAGALAKRVDEDARVVPYLIDDLRPEDVKPPLGMFQAKKSDKEDTWSLVQSINNSLTTPLPQKRLERAFEPQWPSLGEKLKNIPESDIKPERRSPEDMLVEVLDTVRGMAKQLDRLNSSALDEVTTTPLRSPVAINLPEGPAGEIARAWLKISGGTEQNPDQGP